MSSRAPSELDLSSTTYTLFVFCRKLFFWEAVCLLFFDQKLTSADAILLKAFYYISTIMVEVTTAYISLQLDRRVTLLFLFYLQGWLDCFCAR